MIRGRVMSKCGGNDYIVYLVILEQLTKRARGKRDQVIFFQKVSYMYKDFVRPVRVFQFNITTWGKTGVVTIKYSVENMVIIV